MEKENLYLYKMLDYANEKIESLQKQIEKYNKLINLSNKMIKIQSLILLVVPTILFGIGLCVDFNFFTNPVLSNFCKCLFAIMTPTLFGTVVFGFCKYEFKDKKDELEPELISLINAKKVYEKKLANQKINENSLKSKNNTIKNNLDYVTNADAVLENNISKNKVKKLVLSNK